LLRARGKTELEQVSLSARTHFEFGESQLDYVLDGEWLRRIGSLACAIGVLQVGWAAWNGASILAGAILGVGGLCHLLSRRGFTILETDAGEIWIIRDHRHDQILSEVRGRRRALRVALHTGASRLGLSWRQLLRVRQVHKRYRRAMMMPARLVGPAPPGSAVVRERERVFAAWRKEVTAFWGRSCSSTM
jgi:hypothetical protein